MKINDVLKINNEFRLDSLNFLHEFIMIILWVCCSFQGHQFEKENMHGFKVGLLYSFIIVV
jgi:hypothetical protein